jgi:hypothetical protein
MAADSPLVAGVSVAESENVPLLDADPLNDACERVVAIDVPGWVLDETPMVVTRFAPEAVSSLDAL